MCPARWTCRCPGLPIIWIYVHGRPGATVASLEPLLVSSGKAVHDLQRAPSGDTPVGRRRDHGRACMYIHYACMYEGAHAATTSADDDMPSPGQGWLDTVRGAASSPWLDTAFSTLSHTSGRQDDKSPEAGQLSAAYLLPRSELYCSHPSDCSSIFADSESKRRRMHARSGRV